MALLVEAMGLRGLDERASRRRAAAKIWPQARRADEAAGGAPAHEVAAQVHAVRKFYAPLLERRYDHAEPRLRDLEQLEQLAGAFPDRRSMLAEMALDPPASTEDLAGPPLLDEDYLMLSTIHSAKGLEWDAVYVIHASDGNIPSDMATKTPRRSKRSGGCSTSRSRGPRTGSM